jgi:hypothetical protein
LFFRKMPYFRPKFSEIAENCDQIIDPLSKWLIFMKFYTWNGYLFRTVLKPYHRLVTNDQWDCSPPFVATGCNLASIWNLDHHITTLSLEHLSLHITKI